jgi:hypothetical protein
LDDLSDPGGLRFAAFAKRGFFPLSLSRLPVPTPVLPRRRIA